MYVHRRDPSAACLIAAELAVQFAIAWMMAQLEVRWLLLVLCARFCGECFILGSARALQRVLLLKLSPRSLVLLLLLRARAVASFVA